MTEAVQNQNICNGHICSPYKCACTPQSNIVIPQGQVVVPNTPAQLSQVQAIAQVQPNPSVNYNQIEPYINTNSGVFNPSVQTKSGQAIATAYSVGVPVDSSEAQIVYEGPVKTVNPQITPVEQSDNQIEKDFNDYFKFKAEENAELKNALHKSFNDKKRKNSLATMVKVAAAALILTGLYAYRRKIPLVKKLFK